MPFLPSRRCFAALTLGLLTVLAAPRGPAQDKQPFARWEKAIAAFEAQDRTNQPPRNAVVFVGSSTVRMWKLSKSFPDLPTINRGFGGSQLADAVHFAPRIVTKYAPRVVVLYSGDNDIASGKTPAQVLADFNAFVKLVQAALPNTKIIVLSVKPSPSRLKHLTAQRQANTLIAARCKEDERLRFVDVATPMLGGDGQPRPELFLADRLHMNEQGYKLWTSILAPILKKLVPAAKEGKPAAPSTATLSPGVRAVWDLSAAQGDATSTRERVCLNGLWRWQPARESAEVVPSGNWGFFKVPGYWPGNTSYIQEDSQTLHVHPSWKSADLRSLSTAWYQREITVPENWTGRRIGLSAEYVNSFAVVFVDGKKAGELRFPAGEVDLTALCRPGRKHVLSLAVVAMPLKGVLLSYSDTNSAREVKGTVERRGLCGDVFLTSTPAGARITDVKVDTSVRKGELTVSAAIEGLTPKVVYTLRLSVASDDRKFGIGVTFDSRDLQNGRFAHTLKWNPKILWDIHTPQHTASVNVSLVEGPGRNILDACYPVRFGFREFWIDGKDFYLNGKRIHLSAVPLDNAQIGARTATYEAARETFKRLQSFGINFVYTHNYGCQPGSHVSFAEILRAADDVGMLVAFSQPHFGHYDWKTPDADRTNGYARHAEFYVRAAQNHPSVVAYSMSHNATGYGEDMNPHLMDGRRDPRAGETWSQNNASRALRAEAIVKGLDPGRIVYHHSSGNLGSMHTANFYANFVPVQEMSDWFEHWAKHGVKPVFLCEYGVPFTWDWAMYRGWYKGERSFGSAKVPWEFCLAEWNAQFLGDRAFRISEMEKKNLRYEAKQLQAGNLWQRWNYPHQLGSSEFAEREAVFAMYLTDNWRAHRTWGLSANSPWEHHAFWKLRPGIERKRQELKVDWDKLQRPGFSPDYSDWRNGQMPTDHERSDWVATAAAEALYRNNRPLLAWIGGPPGNFTSKGHNFLPGETVAKQLIVLNNSRVAVTCACEWSLGLPAAVRGSDKAAVPTGEQARIPLRFALPDTLPAGTYELSATVRFSNGETQKDKCTINVLPRPNEPQWAATRIALFDPKGETGKLLAGLNVKAVPIEANADLSRYDVLIVGRGALTPSGAGPDVGRVRDGLKVVVFEQTAAVLEQRFGFRVAEYGLRQVFKRVPDHPMLAGLETDHLRDWRGAATLLAPQLDYTMRPRHGPTVKWCGLEVPRLWRCGCRGNVASVLIEKPARGDFLSIVDGGYGLQYSPLLQYREGAGMVLFCQLDVTGRTEREPAADALTRNLLRYVSAWKPPPGRTAFYAGDPAGKKYLDGAGLALKPYQREALSADPAAVLIVGPGGGQALAGDAAAVAQWLKAGGRVLALGLDGKEAQAFLPGKVATTRQEHIAAYFEPFGRDDPLAGIGPAEVHNRDPRPRPLVSGGANVIGDGVLARDGNVVFCQLVPWQFGEQKQMNLRRTFRSSARLVTRLAANMGIGCTTPLLARFRTPVDPATAERRWLTSFYLDVPEEWDDPYRFFRW